MPNRQSQNSLDDYKRLQALFEMATDGIITINNRGVIESINRAGCKLFGYAAEEVRGKKVNILMNDHDRTHHDQYLDRYERTHDPHIIGIGREVVGRRKDGTLFPLRLAVSEVVLEDETVIYTGILHDISAIREAQRKVEQLNAELEEKVEARTAALRLREQQLREALGKEKELNELKSRFLSMASHEFKTPLSTVLSSIELIEMYTEGEQQPKREKHTERIKKAVSQLTDVLNDFLSLSKLEQGKVDVSLKQVNVRAIVASSIEAAEGQFRPGQEVMLKIDEQPAQIESDSKLLKHILINLISNAAKYSDNHKTITIGGGLDGDAYQISIRDEGIGIPPEDQVHLFDRFFRARNVENVKGTGLGLNIVKHYVELLGGSVTFSSDLGSGTTFYVHLPYQKS
ncbi:PAS domain-containing sensor histidine kinase [Lewinella sp. W8]|uniref:PAS domain-containing sensor histidine kinase n=1 Tax=Lewinella sp. W8 TaxID=2528208 RepID=UPI00106734FD|nr:PAS domain-containing sensor histidine kinase [Lewinella sp. W8]MTB51838.1 PAS domain S-box protein [Lewinella sp. W8]